MVQVFVAEEEDTVVAAGNPVVAIVVLADDENIVLGDVFGSCDRVNGHVVLSGPPDTQPFAQDSHQQVGIPVLIAAADNVGTSFRYAEQVVKDDGLGRHLIDTAYQGAYPHGPVFFYENVIDIVGVDGTVGPALGDVEEFPAAAEQVYPLGCADVNVSGSVCSQAGDMVVGQGGWLIRIMGEVGQLPRLDVEAEQPVFRPYPEIVAMGQDGGDIPDMGKLRVLFFGYGREIPVQAFTKTYHAIHSARPNGRFADGHIAQGRGFNGVVLHLPDIAVLVQRDRHQSAPPEDIQRIPSVGHDPDKGPAKQVRFLPQVLGESDGFRCRGYFEKSGVAYAPDVSVSVFCHGIDKVVLDAKGRIRRMGVEVDKAVSVKTVQTVGSAGPQVSRLVFVGGQDIIVTQAFRRGVHAVAELVGPFRTDGRRGQGGQDEDEENTLCHTCSYLGINISKCAENPKIPAHLLH